MDDAILLPYQQRWIEDPSQVKIIEKGRRIGISYSEAADDVLYAGSKKGANVYYISYDKEMTQGFIEDCAAWAKAYNMAAGSIEEELIIEDEDKQILSFAIRFDSGHKIQTFSSNPRKLRSKGKPGEKLIIDEAAFIDDLDELLKSAMAMTVWGGSVCIISTHNGDENAFNELIEDVRKGRYDYSLHRVTLDDALADGLYKRICQVTGQVWSVEAEATWRKALINRYKPNEKEELFCVPAMGGGAYLSRVLIEKNMADAPVVRFEGSASFNMAPESVRRAEMQDWINDNIKPLTAVLNPLRRHVFGMDFARSGDMTDIAPMEKGETLHKTVPFIVELHNVPFKQQEQVLFAVADDLPRLSGGALDATGNGAQIAEAAKDRYGSMIEEVKMSENWYRESFPPYKADLEDGMTTIPKHDDILEDHRAVQLVNGVPRLPKKKTDKKGQRHGDSVVAIVLADTAARKDHASIDFESAGSRAMTEEYTPINSDVGFGSVGGGDNMGGFL